MAPRSLESLSAGDRARAFRWFNASPVGHEVDTNRFVPGGRRGTEHIATANNPWSGARGRSGGTEQTTPVNLRGWCPQGRRGSSPLSDTRKPHA